MLKKIKRINIYLEILILLALEIFKTQFYICFNNYLFIIFNIFFDFLFVNQLLKYLITYFLRKKEKQYLEIFDKIFNFNKIFFIQNFVLLIIGLFFIHSNILYIQIETKRSDFLSQILIGLSSLICFILSKNHGELFYLDSILFIQINNSYEKIDNFSIIENNTVEFVNTSKGKKIRIKYSKDVAEKELLLFFESILGAKTYDNRK